MTRLSELLALRSEYAKHYATDQSGVREADIGVAPLHFRKPDGSWDDIANLVQSVAGGWLATTADVTWGIQNGYLTITRNGRSLTMRPARIGMVDRTDPMNRFRKLADASYANVSRSGDTITVSNIFPQTDLVVKIGPKVLSKDFIVRQKPNIPDPISLGWDPAQTYIVFDWDVNLPAGAVVRDTVTGQQLGNGFYAGNNDLAITTPSGETVVYFAKGFSLSSSGHSRPVWYISKPPEITFGEALDYHRTQVSTYPLTVDPTSSFGALSGAGNIVSGASVFTDYIIWGGGNDGKGGTWTNRGFARLDLTTLADYTITNATWYYTLFIAGYDTYVWDVGDYGALDLSDWGRTLIRIVGYQPGSGSSTSWNSWLSALNARTGQILGMEFQNDSTITQGAILTSPYLSLTYNYNKVPDGPGPALDAIFRATKSGTFSLDAYIHGVSNFPINAVLTKSQSGTFTLDAVVPAASSGSFSMAAILSRSQTAVFTLDASKRATFSGSTTIDAVKRATLGAVLTADAIKRTAQSGSVTADALLRRIQTATFTAAAAKRSTQSGTFTLDAYRKASQSGTVTLDAIVRRTQTGTITLDASKVRTTAASFVANAIKRVAQSGSFTENATVRRTQATTTTLDAFITRTSSGSFVVQSLIRRTQTGAFTESADIKAVSIGSVTLDAAKKASVSGAFTANAIRQRTQSAVFTANAFILASRTGSFSASALVKRTTSDTFTIGAIKLRTSVSLVTLDAFKLKTVTGAVTADAVFRQTRTDGFAADAVRLSTQLGTFGLGAFIRPQSPHIPYTIGARSSAMTFASTATARTNRAFSSSTTNAASSGAVTSRATTSTVSIEGTVYVDIHGSAFPLDAVIA